MSKRITYRWVQSPIPKDEIIESPRGTAASRESDVDVPQAHAVQLASATATAAGGVLALISLAVGIWKDDGNLAVVGVCLSIIAGFVLYLILAAWLSWRFVLQHRRQFIQEPVLWVEPRKMSKRALGRMRKQANDTERSYEDDLFEFVRSIFPDGGAQPALDARTWTGRMMASGQKMSRSKYTKMMGELTHCRIIVGRKPGAAGHWNPAVESLTEAYDLLGFDLEEES